jgi:hypothetical protein
VVRLIPMTAAKKLEPSADPLRAPTSARPLTAEQRAEVERALVEIAGGNIPPLSSEDVRRAIEDRLREEEEARARQLGDLSPDGGIILSPDDEAELLERIAETDEDFRAGRLLTWEQFLEQRAVRRAG